MNRRNLILAASLALVAGALVFARFTLEEDVAPPGTRQPPLVKIHESTAAPEVAAVPIAARRALPADHEYVAEFMAADDLLEFSRRMHVAADAGDTVAMYYIHAAGDRCVIDYSMAFDAEDGKTEVTLEEALAREATIGVSGGVEKVRRLYMQCMNWRMMPPEDHQARKKHLEHSANAGYPPAQAEWASHLMTWHGNHENSTPEERARARELTLAALRSRDPNAYYEAQYVVQKFTHGDEYDEIGAAAWFYAACLRGVECGPQSEMVRMHCTRDTACQPYEDLIDILRRGKHANQAGEIERRAREISDFIDAGRWAELGIGD